MALTINQEEKFKNADKNANDVVEFFIQLNNDYRFLTSRIRLRSYTRDDNPKEYESHGLDTMTLIKIVFVVYEIESLKTETWMWKCYRAKNFNCSNSSFEELK